MYTCKGPRRPKTTETIGVVGDGRVSRASSINPSCSTRGRIRGTSCGLSDDETSGGWSRMLHKVEFPSLPRG